MESRAGSWTGSACCPCAFASTGTRRWRGRSVRRWASPWKGTRSTTGWPTCGAGAVPGRVPGGGGVGTHWHGSLESDAFRRRFLVEVARAAGRRFVPAPDTSFGVLREEQLDRLGDLVEEHADTDALWRLIEGGAPPGCRSCRPGRLRCRVARVRMVWRAGAPLRPRSSIAGGLDHAGSTGARARGLVRPVTQKLNSMSTRRPCEYAVSLHRDRRAGRPAARALAERRQSGRRRGARAG